jgi:hypothetical protein
VVNSEGVTAMPVAAFVYESAKGRCLVIRQGQEGRVSGKDGLFSFGKMGSDVLKIRKEKAESEHDINFRVQSRCLLQCQ